MSEGNIFFRFQKSEDRTFRVYNGGPYASIQAAIDAADTFLGGVGTPANSATVIVFPNGTGYTEDLTLKRGVMVKTASAFYGRFRDPVIINGEHTFTPDAAGSAANGVLILGFNLQNTNVGQSILKLDGANAGRLEVNSCNFNQSGSVAGAVNCSNTGGGSARVYLKNCNIFAVGGGTTGAKGIVNSGSARVRAENCDIECDGGGAGVANHVLENTGTGRIRVTGSLLFCDGDPESILVTSGTVQLYNSTLNQIASGLGRHIFEMGAGTGVLGLTSSTLIHNDSGNHVNGTAGTVSLYGVSVSNNAVRVASTLTPDTGSSVQSSKTNFAATAAPGVSDDETLGYAVGSVWIDVTLDDAYVCLDATTGAAVWKKTTP